MQRIPQYEWSKMFISRRLLSEMGGGGRGRLFVKRADTKNCSVLLDIALDFTTHDSESVVARI